MALSEKHRSSLFTSLSPLVGTEEAEALLQEFPATDLDVPATKDFVRSEVGALRSEVHEQIGLLRKEVHQEIGLFRTEMRQEIGSVRGEIGSVRGEMGALRDEVGSLRTEVVALRTDVHRDLLAFSGAMSRQTMWLTGAVVTAMGVLSGINTWVVLSTH